MSVVLASTVAKIAAFVLNNKTPEGMSRRELGTLAGYLALLCALDDAGPAEHDRAVKVYRAARQYAFRRRLPYLDTELRQLGHGAVIDCANGAYYKANRVTRLAYQATYIAANPEKVRESGRKYREANPEKVKAVSQMRRARMVAALDPTASPKAIAELNRKASLASAFMLDAEPRGFAVDHIVPLARGGKHHEDNLRVLPARLNSVKGAKLDHEVTSPDFHAWLDPTPTFET